ncbi:MAG TPA: TetR/AcrR family transcriptional regulator, partial [Candidatus Methylacidiphilales bacterium]
MRTFPRIADTSQRIIEAATRVFAREGIAGATTREIARRAKVNEVTLFRHFKNKQELLQQVVLKSSKDYESVFENAPRETIDDVHRMVEAHVAVYMRKLRANEEFIRTFYGELTRHPQLCRQFFANSFRPRRRKFIAYLQAAQKEGLVWDKLDVTTAADALTGMLVAGILRRPFTDEEYSNSRFCQ